MNDEEWRGPDESLSGCTIVAVVFALMLAGIAFGLYHWWR